jgi:hypothetical protein
MVLRFVVDVHTTYFGLHGHLQVCKILYFFSPEGICFAAFVAFVACYIMQFLICVCFFCCVSVNFHFHVCVFGFFRFSLLQCNRMLKYNIIDQKTGETSVCVCVLVCV